MWKTACLGVLIVLAGGGLLLPVYADEEDVPPPPGCDTLCHMTQYNKKCASGIYFYFTTKTCYLCSGTTTYCLTKSDGSTCMEVQNDPTPMMLKIIMSSEACACLKSDGTQYDSVEAKMVDPGVVDSTPLPRKLCYD